MAAVRPWTAAAGLSRGERSLLGFFGAAWAVSLLHLTGVLPLAGALPLSLYGYYAFAAVAGWLAGNVFVLRRRRLGARGAGVSSAGARGTGARGPGGPGRPGEGGPGAGGRGAAAHRDLGLLAILYFCGPPSLVYLLRALAPPEHHQAAPLAPLWAFGVYGVFFLVPIVLPPPARSRDRRRR